MSRIVLIALIIAGSIESVSAQSCDPLEPAEQSGLEAILSGDNQVTEACVISESDEHIAFQVKYKGFSDKKYTATAKILGAGKTAMREFEPVKVELGQGGNSFDLRFEFKKSSKTYKKPSVKSRYLQIAIEEKDGFLSGIEISGSSILGSSYLFELDRQWEVNSSGDNSHVNLTVKLTPYKSAATIKQ